ASKPRDSTLCLSPAKIFKRPHYKRLRLLDSDVIGSCVKYLRLQAERAIPECKSCLLKGVGYQQLRVALQSRRPSRPGRITPQLVLFSWRDIALGAVGQLDHTNTRQRSLL